MSAALEPRVNRPLPVIHQTTEEESGPWRVQWLDLEFSNGERRRYERILARGHGAVVVVPFLEDGSVVLVREYAAGLHRYELGLVKGRMDAGETPEQAANRELQEEAGYRASRVEHLRMLSLSPGYMTHQTHVVVATGLVPGRLPGDEPEELEVVTWPLARLPELLAHEEVSDARSLAALWAASEWWRAQR